MAFDWANYRKFKTKKEAFAASDSDVWYVDMYESEAGWGGKVDDTHYFISKDEAERFVKDYNTEFNSTKITPSYYIMAMKPVKL